MWMQSKIKRRKNRKKMVHQSLPVWTMGNSYFLTVIQHRYHTWSRVKSFNILLGYCVALWFPQVWQVCPHFRPGDNSSMDPSPFKSPPILFNTDLVVHIFNSHKWPPFCARQREYSLWPWYCKDHLVWTTAVSTCGEIHFGFYILYK